MTLEELRDKAFYQNTIDVWIMLCNEKGVNSYDTDKYTKFISYLNSKGLKMQKFPLCIKESGGTFDRGMDKARFLDALSKVYSEDASAYTLKLSPDNISTLRKFFE
jgi:hypothetical protein